MKKLGIFLSFLLIIAFTSTLYSPAVPEPFNIITFSENDLLSQKPMYHPYYYHVEPTLVITANGTLFAGWKDATSHSGIGRRVSFTKSVDNGITWTEPLTMPFPPGLEWKAGQSDPWMTWDEENEILYYAYLEYEDDYFLNFTGFSQITVAKSTDYGQSWTIVPASHGFGFADKETITVSNNGTVYMVYDDADFTSPDLDIYVRLTRSTDGGESFKEVNVITDSITRPISPFAPYVTTNSHGHIYVAWMQYTDEDADGRLTWGDVYLSYSTDQGETFSDPIDINPYSENCSSSGIVAGRGTFPVIRFDAQDRLYALWAGKYDPDINAKWDVFIKYSDDYGQTWSPRYRVNPRANWDQWHPEMAIDSFGRVHVVYYDMYETATEFRPYYRMIEFADNLTGTPIFHDAIPIASRYTDYYFKRPGEYFAIKFDSIDRPHVVWTQGEGERRGPLNIYYAHGLTESELPIPTSTPEASTTPTTFISTSPQTSSGIHVASSTTSSMTSESTTSTTSIASFISIFWVMFCLLLVKRKKT
ncbi:MAG: sialidase family protein [Promethearchaeota archaeon]